MISMLDKPMVVDDVISDQYQAELEHAFVGQTQAPWYFLQETDQYGGQVDPINVMFHMIYNEQQGVNSKLFALVKPLLFELIGRSNTRFTEFLQVRAMCHFPVITDRKTTAIHTDFNIPVPYCTGVYYVNRNIDGETILYNKTHHNIPPEQVASRLGEFEEILRVEPRRGSAVMFDGATYHCGAVPTKKPRVLLNFSWR
jgi:hypothetical protein